MPGAVNMAARVRGTAKERDKGTISFAGDDQAFVTALRARQPAAVAAFHDRYAEHMLRILMRILGNDPELEDVHHDVFVRALASIGTLRDASRLTAWMVSVAVLSARTCLQRRHRGRWLSFISPDDLLETDRAGYEPDWTLRMEIRATYEILDRLPAEERIVFALRFIEEMDLNEVAQANRISLATAKRRLKRAESRFLALSRRHPVLRGWAEQGDTCDND